MPGISASQIADLMLATRKATPDGMKFRLVNQQLQSYEVMGRWLRDDKMEIRGGTGVEGILVNKTSSAARHIGMFTNDVTEHKPLAARWQVDWVHASTYYIWERREALMNVGDATKIVDEIQGRRMSSLLSMADILEDAGWSTPAYGSTTLPLGLPTWLQKNATTGFNGGAPSGYSNTLAGINVETEPNFKNYTATFTALTRADGIRKMLRAKRDTYFRSPIPGSSAAIQQDSARRFRIYTTNANLEDLEDQVIMQNDNIGNDLSGREKFGKGGVAIDQDGFVKVWGHYVMAVPKLDDDTDNPIYMVDLDAFKFFCLKGDYMEESDPYPLRGLQHNTWRVDVDITYAIVCPNRKANAVLYKVSS